MKPDRWQKVDEILQAALQHSSDDRKAFIDEACRGNEELRQEVESLLAQQSEADQFMEEPAMAVMARDLADEQRDGLIGRNLGPYKIVSLLGAGGMGKVYRAQDTRLRRDVAMKILPTVFVSDGNRRARFERLLFVRAVPTPEDLHATAQEQEKVRAVLAGMPRRTGALLLLQSEGLSYTELAAALEINPASVGTLLARARQAFRKEYIKRYGER